MKKDNKYDKLLLLIGLLWAFYISVLRSLRIPNDWAEAQWLLSYKFGFIKRGLPGTLLSPLINPGDPLFTEVLISVLSYTCFLFFCGLLCWSCYRIIKISEFEVSTVSVIMVFLSSPYIIMSAHLNGYFDNIIIIITILACLFIIHGKILNSAIMLFIGVLVHESIILIGIPSVLFLAFVKYTKDSERPTDVRSFSEFLSCNKLLVILPLFSFACIIISQMILNPEIVKSQLTLYLSKFDFIKQNRAVIVPTLITTSFLKYLLNQGAEFFPRIFNILFIIHTGFPLIVLLSYAWIRLKITSSNKMLFKLLVIITVLPLTIHLIAWDTSRIWSYPIIIAFIAIWSINEIYPYAETNGELSLLLLLTSIFVFAFQIIFSTPLMDSAIDRFSKEGRILLYSPAILLFIYFASKNYYIRRSP